MYFDFKALLEWYQGIKRPLPWRKNKNPYLVLVSEVMSQQTTITAMRPFFERFVIEFPSFEALAAAPQEKVNQLWVGLGYPTRAKNLQLSAKMIVKQEIVPHTFDRWLELPGVGPYTAAAVSSICFDYPKAVVDGNVIRVFSRYTGMPIEHWKSKGREQIQVTLDQIILQTHKLKISPGDFNQAIMELGALVCKKQSPSCPLCPLVKNCAAYDKGIVNELPLPKPVQKNKMWKWNIFIIEKKKKYWTTQLPLGAPFLKGQWVFCSQISQVTRFNDKPHFTHTITNNKMGVYIETIKNKQHIDQLLKNQGQGAWQTGDELLQKSPFSVNQKIIDWHGQMGT